MAAQGFLGNILNSLGGGVVEVAKEGIRQKAQDKLLEAQTKREENLMRLRQEFATSEREAGQEFTKGLKAEELESKEKIAGVKAVAASQKATEKLTEQQQKRVDQKARDVRSLIRDEKEFGRLRTLTQPDTNAIESKAVKLIEESGGELNVPEAFDLAYRYVKAGPEARAAAKAAGIKPGPMMEPKEGVLRSAAGGQGRAYSERARSQAAPQEQGRKISRAEIQRTAKNRGITEDEVIKMLEASGKPFTIIE